MAARKVEDKLTESQQVSRGTHKWTQSTTSTHQPCDLVFLGIRSNGGSRQLRWWYWQQLSHLTSRCWLRVFLHVSHLSHIVTQCAQCHNVQCHTVSHLSHIVSQCTQCYNLQCHTVSHLSHNELCAMCSVTVYSVTPVIHCLTLYSVTMCSVYTPKVWNHVHKSIKLKRRIRAHKFWTDATTISFMLSKLTESVHLCGEICSGAVQVTYLCSKPEEGSADRFSGGDFVGRWLRNTPGPRCLTWQPHTQVQLTDYDINAYVLTNRLVALVILITVSKVLFCSFIDGVASTRAGVHPPPPSPSLNRSWKKDQQHCLANNKSCFAWC